MGECRLCPRQCGADRSAGQFGFCGVGANPVVARAAPHFGEEPCISGTRGSGAVFFAGCTLRCVFCQNFALSRGKVGETISVSRLREIFLSLRDQGVHNLNLVTGSHFVPAIAEALRGVDLGIPVVWNSSGYESVETLRLLDGLVQVYLPDLKYLDAGLAKAYSAAPNYPQVATAAIWEMYRQVGAYQMDADGMLQKGLMIRHLILPDEAENSKRVIDWVFDALPPEDILFSLMSQYTPMGEARRFPKLKSTVSPALNEEIYQYLMDSKIENGFYQDLESATKDMIPRFDGTGVIK